MRLRLSRALLPIALVLLLAAGCGSSGQRAVCEVVLRAVPTKGQPITAAQMQIAQQIISRRLDTIGVSSPTVTVRGNEIVIQLPGVHHPGNVSQLVGTTGRLQIFDFEPSLAAPSVTANQQRPAPLPSLYSLLAPVQKEAGQGSPQAYYLFKAGANNPAVVQGPAPTVHDLLLPYKSGKRPPHTQVLKVPANREPVLCAVATGCPGADSRTGKSGQAWYLFKSPSALTGKDLVESGTVASVDPSTGQPIVTLEFTGRGSKEFQRITKAEYNRGRVDAGLAGRLDATSANTIAAYAGHNAIVLDSKLLETPYIDFTDPALSQGIVGNVQITEPSVQAAKRTAFVLRSGSLPYTFKRVGVSNCAGS
jgi:preprotein translocase subunit SecD